MSKANRRRQRPGSQPPNARSVGGPPPTSSGDGRPAADPDRPVGADEAQTGADATARAAAAASLSGNGAAATTRSTGGGRPAGSTPRTSGVRHGRRERSRALYQPSFVERYRTAIFGGAAILGVVLVAGFVFLSASQPAYGCTQIWSPAPTASPGPSATPNLGYVQPDMGHTHVAPGTKVTYTYCAPASGDHYNKSGLGPITPRVFGPNDSVVPQSWVHNLEHGALVILYKGTSPGATTDGQTQLKTFFDSFPNSPRCDKAKGLVGPVIARFDDMSTPFQAMVWGRVLPLETFDQAQILAFFKQWGDRSNPEDQCPNVPRTLTTSASPSGSAPPSGSVAPTATPVPSVSAVPSPS